MIRWLALLFRTPSSRPDDPAAWLGTQAAHALVVGGGAVLICWAPGRPGAGVIFTACLYAGWELGQWWCFRSSRLDGLTDWLFVVSGAVLAWAGLAGDRAVFAMALAALVAAGVLGVWRRLP